MQVRDIHEVHGEERSVRTLLDSRTKNGRTYQLDTLSPGWEPAGSCMRLRESVTFSVTFREASGTLNGRQFETEAEARELFDAWTKA